ncbi:MAG: hypothetical protein JRI91_06855 [Deltaproteobacteria bacterium]|nr:hypothetical protein [Deltaproteobacteria bacterium]
MIYRKLVVLIVCLIVAQAANGYDGLKTVVGITNFENSTFYKDVDEAAVAIDNHLMEELQKNCPDIIFQRFEKPAETDNQKIAFAGRSAGVNAVVTCKLTDIRGVEEELGFWFFEKVVYFAEVHALIEIYDTETAAKLFVASFEDEVEIEREQFDSLVSKTASGKLPDIQNPLKSIAESIGEEVCGIVEDEPFKAYLSSVEGNTVMVTSGSNAGLAKGMKFKMYGNQESVAGKAGTEFYFKGSEVGEIEIITVAPGSAEGRIISGRIATTDICLKEKEKDSWF